MTSLTTTPYPFSTPQILTDEIFKNFGGSIENTAKAQRDYAYVMAEYAASTDLDTYLPTTTVTGLYAYSPRIMLEHSYVSKVHLVQYLDYQDVVYYTITGTLTQYMKLWNQDYGIVDLYADYAHGCYGGCTHLDYPTRLRIVYDTGLGSGTAYNPNILMALTTYSTIMLNEMIGFGNEAPGDVGISNFSNQDYSEKRKGLINTVFGQSPKANFAHRLLSKFRKRRYVGL